jgi:hypothetical protein
MLLIEILMLKNKEIARPYTMNLPSHTDHSINAVYLYKTITNCSRHLN